MPGPDPGITDRCIFLNPGIPNFWESDDIRLNPSGPLPGHAHVGANTVEVTVRKKADCGVTGGVLIDLFVCNPSVAVVPPGVIPGASKKITNVIPTSPDAFIANGGAIPTAGQTFTVTWTIAAGTPASEPDGPEHRCLVARCYPFQGSAPDAGDFHVQTGPGLGDAHSVQKNITIDSVQGIRKREFRLNAANTDPKKPARITVRAVANLMPDERSLKVLIPMLRHVPGFNRVAPKPPKAFRLFAPDIRNAKVRDATHGTWIDRLLGQVPAQPTFDLKLKLEPHHLAECVLETDLSSTPKGDAHVFNLTQLNEHGEAVGGLTVVTVQV